MRKKLKKKIDEIDLKRFKTHEDKVLLERYREQLKGFDKNQEAIKQDFEIVLDEEKYSETVLKHDLGMYHVNFYP